MSDDDEGEYEAAAKEHHHHAEETPFILHRKWQVLLKEKSTVIQPDWKKT